MTPVTSFAGRRVAVFGLGVSGLASCRALLAGGARVIAFDDSAGKLAEAKSAGLETGDLRGIVWSEVSALVMAPGVPLTHPEPHWSVLLARKAGVEVIGDVELFCRERRLSTPDSPFVAVTGTNGKSTTTALIAHLLKSAGRNVAVGGNLGTAILALDPPTHERVHVIECSSFQIDLSPSLDPSVGILLNVSPDHLDRHGTMENYAGIKERLVAGVPDHGTAVVGVDDAWCRIIADRLERKGVTPVRVSVQGPLLDGVFLDGDHIMRASAGKRAVVARLFGIETLRGLHNAQNAACAVAAALALGLSPADIQRGLASFPGLAHRMEQVGRKGRVLFVNDSKATNADAAGRALASYADIFWIAGGRAKSGGIRPLSAYFPRIRKAYLIGEAADDFAATLNQQVPHVHAGTLERAVELAARDAERSDASEPVVLLSPACASYDQFANFEMRGDAFRALARAIPGIV